MLNVLVNFVGPVLLSAGKKVAANTGLRVATSVATTLTSAAINNGINAAENKKLAGKELTEEEIKSIESKRLLRGAVVSGIVATAGYYGNKYGSEKIESSK